LFLSLVLMLLYYLAIIAGTGNPKIPPVVTAWGPNVVFAILGLILMTRADRSHESRLLDVLGGWTNRGAEWLSAL
jgi:hypothetical protein